MAIVNNNKMDDNRLCIFVATITITGIAIAIASVFVCVCASLSLPLGRSIPISFPSLSIDWPPQWQRLDSVIATGQTDVKLVQLIPAQSLNKHTETFFRTTNTISITLRLPIDRFSFSYSATT